MLAVGLMNSCARRKIVPFDRPIPDPTTLLRSTAENSAKLQDFTGAGLLEIETEQGERIALGINLQYLQPDYFALTLRGFLGIKLGSLILAGEYYQLDFKAEGFSQSGKVANLEMPTTLGFPVSQSDLKSFLSPLINLPSLPDSIGLSVAPDQQYYLIGWADSSRLNTLWVETYRPIVTRWLTTTAAGDTLTFREVEQIEKRENIYLPTAWKFSIGQGEKAFRLAAHLSRLQVNTGLNAADFNLFIIAQPDSVEEKN